MNIAKKISYCPQKTQASKKGDGAINQMICMTDKIYKALDNGERRNGLFGYFESIRQGVAQRSFVQTQTFWCMWPPL